MSFNKFSLPLAMIVAIVLTAGIALAANTQFSVDTSSLYLSGPGFSKNITLTRLGTNDNLSVDIDTGTLTDGLGNTITVTPDPSNILLNISSLNNTKVNLTAAVSGDPAGHYTGTIVAHNTTDPAAANSSITTTLDVPLAFLTGLAGAEVNMSGNKTILFNASDVSGSKGIYIMSNSSSTVITLKKGATTVNASTGNLTYFNYASGITGDHTIELTTGTGTVALTVWLIPFDLTDAVVKSTNSGEARNNSETFNTTSVRNLSFILNNTGPYAYDIDYTSDSSVLKLSATKNMSFVQNLDGITSLGSMSTETAQMQYDMGANANQEGVYTGWIKFNLENGGLTVPINMTLKVGVSKTLNVTVISVIDQIDGDNVINDTSAKLNITVEVKYMNGTAVSNLNTTNFTTSLRTYYMVGTTNTSKTRAATMLSVPETGPYILNASVANADYGGTFLVTVNATDGAGNSGSGTRSPIYINESFFVINTEAVGCTGDAECSGNSVTEGSINDKFYMNVDVKNYGYLAATGVKVELGTEDCVILLDDGEWTDDSTITIGNISAGANISTYHAWKFELDASGDCTISVVGDSHTSETWIASSIDVEVIGDEDDDTGTPDSGGDTTGELSIYSFPPTTSVAAGSTKTVQVKVKNTLPTSLSNVKVYVDYIDSDWYTGPYSATIASGAMVTYNITFNIPSDAEVKSYSIKFVTNTSAVVDRETATLVVTGVGTAEEEPSTQAEGFSTRYDVLYELYNEAVAQGKNVTDTKKNLDAAKVLMDQAQSYLDQGKTTEAENLFSQINTLLTKAEDSLGTIKMQQLTQTASGWYGAIIVGVIAVLGGIIYVLKKQTGGYHHERGYSYVPEHHRNKSLYDRFKEKIDNLKKVDKI